MAQGETLSGTVVAISDGDTLNVLDAQNRQHKIRLAGIDAPERKQAFGTAARQSLSKLAFGKAILVDFHKRDRYGRLVAKVLVSGLDVNLEQLRRGYSWHYREYQHEQTLEDRQAYAAARNTTLL